MIVVDHFPIYKNIGSLCCTPESNTSIIPKKKKAEKSRHLARKLSKTLV